MSTIEINPRWLGVYVVVIAIAFLVGFVFLLIGITWATPSTWNWDVERINKILEEALETAKRFETLK